MSRYQVSFFGEDSICMRISKMNPNQDTNSVYLPNFSTGDSSTSLTSPPLTKSPLIHCGMNRRIETS